MTKGEWLSTHHRGEVLSEPKPRCTGCVRLRKLRAGWKRRRTQGTKNQLSGYITRRSRVAKKKVRKDGRLPRTWGRDPRHKATAQESGAHGTFFEDLNKGGGACTFSKEEDPKN